MRNLGDSAGWGNISGFCRCPEFRSDSRKAEYTDDYIDAVYVLKEWRFLELLLIDGLLLDQTRFCEKGEHSLKILWWARWRKLGGSIDLRRLAIWRRPGRESFLFPTRIGPRKTSRWGFGAVAIVILASISLAKDPEAAAEDLHRYEFSGVAMAAPVKLIVYAKDQETAESTWGAVMARLEELNQLFSDYDPESELSRLCTLGGPGWPIRVSRELWEVLSRAKEFSRLSEGAFDVTVGPVVRLWRRARRQKALPSQARIAEALQFVGYEKVRLEEKNLTVELLREGMRLDLGGIAKGYAGDQVLSLLAERGISRALLDIGGDIRLGDPPPGTEGWRVAIEPFGDEDRPPQVLLLSRCAIATSGDTERFVILGGRRYSHIVDPRTGWALTGNMQVTIVAPEGITADALASAVRVMGPEKGLALVDKLPGTAGFVVYLPDGSPPDAPPLVFASKRWAELPHPSFPDSRDDLNRQGLSNSR